MLEAYFDESGTHETSEAVTVGGFIASREKWEAFAIEWKAFLDSEGIERFHRVDIESFQKEFKRENGWDENRRDKVINQAQAIIGRHMARGYARSVVKDDYDRVIVDVDIRRKLGRNYYTFCAESCMRDIANWAWLGGHNEAISYFFELGAKGAGELTQLMEKRCKVKSNRALFRFAGLSFVKKYDEVIDDVLFPGVVQLHAADLLAYECFKLMENRRVDGVERPMRQSMSHLQSLLQINHTHSDEAELEFWVKCIRRGTVPYL